MAASCRASRLGQVRSGSISLPQRGRSLKRGVRQEQQRQRRRAAAAPAGTRRRDAADDVVGTTRGRVAAGSSLQASSGIKRKLQELLKGYPEPEHATLECLGARCAEARSASARWILARVREEPRGGGGCAQQPARARDAAPRVPIRVRSFGARPARRGRALHDRLPAMGRAFGACNLLAAPHGNAPCSSSRAAARAQERHKRA